MGDTIDIFIKYAGPPLPLALQVARGLETPGFFSGSHYAWIPVDAARWIDASGWGLLSLDGSASLGRCSAGSPISASRC